MKTDDDVPQLKRSRPTARGVLTVLLALAGVLAVVAVVLLRGMDGPLVLENDGEGGTGPAEVGTLLSATMSIAMPGDGPATIKAVRTKVDDGLDVREAYVWRRGSAPLGAAVEPWPLTGIPAQEKGTFKQPGNFAMSTRRAGSTSSTLVTVVARPTRAGLQTFRSVEIDYTRGMRRHRKTFDLGFAACVNPKGTAKPSVDFCAKPGS